MDEWRDEGWMLMDDVVVRGDAKTPQAVKVSLLLLPRSQSSSLRSISLRDLQGLPNTCPRHRSPQSL